MTLQARPEVWLRGPVAGVPAELMPAAHALLQAGEELERAASPLTPEALWLEPGGAASVGFHLRHVVGVIDRLLTYARGEQLAPAQLAALRREREPGHPQADARELLDAADRAIAHAVETLRHTPAHALHEPRDVGRARLPSTVLGLLFHAAEHVQRHAGQALTTAKIIRALGSDAARGGTPAERRR